MGRPKIEVVKIDIEGAELLALRGARDFLRECRPTIFLEIEPRNLKAYPYSKEDVVRFFEENDYGLFSLEGDEIGSKNIGQSGRKIDTFCARPINTERACR